MNIEDIIRSENGMNFTDILKDFMNVREEKTKLNFYTGKVVDNNDPDKLGRCKIRVYSVFDNEIPDADLPWAIPDFNFIGSDLGSFIVPPNDTILKVYFDSGDYHTPRYTTKVIETNNLNFTADKDEDYPDTMVFFETNQQEYFKINRKTLTSTYRHASGTIFTIDKYGNIEINNNSAVLGENGSLIIGIQGNVAFAVEGDTTIETNKGCSVIAGGDVIIDSVEGDVSLGHGLEMNLVNNLPACLVTGAPHSTQKNVRA
jgi:hypothetical protein